MDYFPRKDLVRRVADMIKGFNLKVYSFAFKRIITQLFI
jgi:hypothetical protein